jgi:putative peptidoglycan lipid II flippase
VTLEEGASARLRGVARSAVTLTGGAVATQALGAARELFLAASIGATGALDAVLIALILPGAFAGVLTSGIVRAIVPAYLEVEHGGGREPARRLAGSLIGWAGLAGLAVWLFLTAFSSTIVTIAGPGLSPEGRADANGYLQLLAPIALVTTVSTILAAICQAEERFAAIAASSFLGTATVIGTMLIGWHSLGLRGLVLGTLLGSLVNLAILVWSAVRGGFLPIPGFRRDAELGRLVRHAVPLTISAAILQINVIGDRAIASLLGPGAVSILRYADVLVRVPFGAIGPAWGSAIYPALVRSSLAGVTGSLAATSVRAIHYILAIFVPIACLTAAVAPLAVGAAYERGAFLETDVATTARTVAGFAPLLVILMLVPILTGAHNARRRGALLLVGGMTNVAVNISLDLILGRWLGVAGIAIASSVAEGTVLVFFIYRLSRFGDAFELRGVARKAALALVASAPGTILIGAIVWTGVVPHDTVAAVAGLVVAGLVGAGAYFLSATLLGLSEPATIWRALTNGFQARLRPRTGI